jgi:hypothetical protein
MPNLHNRYKSAERKISQKKMEYLLNYSLPYSCSKNIYVKFKCGFDKNQPNLHRKGPYRQWCLLLYKFESPFVNEMSCNLQLHVISSSGECYIKIYFNVAYVYFPM